jgi:DNA-binding NarL/FixJ family response regulator
MKPTKDRCSAAARRSVFILDDHPITRYGLIQLINRTADLRVCGDAETAPQALTAIKSVCPDLVLADVTLPGKSGLEFVKDLQAQNSRIPVLVISMHDENIYAERVLRAGARGYIMKNQGGEKLLEAIRQVLEGKVYVSPSMAAALLDLLTRPRSGAREATPSVLSDREFEVFQLIGQGLSARQIGERLNLSVKTVATHRQHIRQKLNLRTGPELIQQAVRWSATQQLV